MICNKCGGNNPDGSNYCKFCRSELSSNNFNYNNNYNNNGFVYNTPAPEDNSGLNRIMNPKVPFKTIIILIIIAVFVLVICLLPDDKKEGSSSKKKNDEPFVGTWLCSYNYNAKKSEAAAIIMFKENGEFLRGKNNDYEFNNYKGTYTSEKLDKTNGAGTAEYYSIKIKLNSYIIDGKERTDFPEELDYEIGYSTKKDSNGEITSVIANAKTADLVYCYKK